MDTPSHQFIVLAYGDSPYLKACLESLFLQRSASDVIVTTSTPSEHISRIASSCGVPVRTAQSSRGIADDWNFGLSCATAKIVTLAHQDDLYYPDFAGETRQLFRRTPSASLSFTGYEEIGEQGHRLPLGRVVAVKRILVSLALGRNEALRSRIQKRSLLAFGTMIPCPSVSFNRAVVGDFRFSDRYEINLDWEAWWRLHSFDNPFVHTQRVLMGHRIHPGATTSQGTRDGRLDAEDLRMFTEIWPRPLASALGVAYRVRH
jgi:hypothetical protein